MVNKAKEILEAAQSGTDGNIMVVKFRFGVQISTGNGNPLFGVSGKEEVVLRAALKELETSGYIEPAGESSYRLTHEGWNCEF